MKAFTRQLQALPDQEELRRVCKAIATLDAILEREWEHRYYSYNSIWDDHEEMASMRDGEGNFFFVLFGREGVILKGYEKDSPLGEYYEERGNSWPGVLDEVPSTFSEFLSEPAFYVGQATFCIWRENTDSTWQTGKISLPEDLDDPDGSERLLRILDGVPRTFVDWAESYHEISLRSEEVERIYRHEPLSEALLSSINPTRSVSELESDLREIGYPALD
ncbi:MAG: hypothetical protein ABI857_02870 [Acidobacteriota bacterium]